MPWILGFALSASFLQENRQAEKMPPDDNMSPMLWTMKQVGALLPTRTSKLTLCEDEDGEEMSIIYFYKIYETEPPQLHRMDNGPTDEEMEPLRTQFGFREQWYYKTNNAFHDRPSRPVVYVEALTQEAQAKEMHRQRMDGMKIEKREDGHASNSVAG